MTVPTVSIFANLLQEYILVKDTRFYTAVKESKKLTPESEELLKDAIKKVLAEVQTL